MAGGIAPLSGIRGFVNPDPEATPEQISGGVADPRHGAPGEVARPFPYERNFPGQPHGPYGLDNQLLGVEDYAYFTPAGQLFQDPTGDETPVTHAAPWPKGMPTTTDPEDVAIRRQESLDIHSSDMGTSREMLYIPTANPVQADWSELWEVDPGVSFPQLSEIPNQAKGIGAGGWGSRDRTQSFARQNGYGFDSAHMHRRIVEPGGNSLPGTYMWMEPGSRPLVKSIPGTAGVPAGYDSPFYGQDPGASYDAQGAVLATLPADYAGVPQPALASDYAGPNGPNVTDESGDWGYY
jgi:hypothetical protein